MSAGGKTTNHISVMPRSQDLDRIAHVRNSRREFVGRVVTEPQLLASSLVAARSDDALAGLLVVKVLQEVPTVGKVMARRALARHGHDEFVTVGQLTVEDIENLVADILE